MIARLRTCLPEKLFFAVVLNLWVSVPYFYLQHHLFFPPRIMTPTWLDAMIAFNADTVWVYQSLHLLIPIAPFLMTSRDALRRYAWGLAGISLACDLVFLFMPTTFPARPDAATLNAGYRFLVAMDAPLHAFPSLHCALALYSALCVRQVFLRVGPRVWVLTWSAIVVYSTLTTKQHVLPDVFAGLLLGGAGYWAAFGSSIRQGGMAMATAANFKRYLKTGLMAFAVVAVAAVGYTVAQNVGDTRPADRQALLVIKDVYEQALSGDQIDSLAPYVAKDFSGVLATGAEVNGMAEWKSHWGQMKDLIGIGKGGKYQVTLKPVLGGTVFINDYAFSYGTTDEVVATSREPNKEYKFSSTWGAVSRKSQGAWKLVGVRTSMLNPENVFSPEQLQNVQALVAELKKKQNSKGG